jgi:hypothetical protein
LPICQLTAMLVAAVACPGGGSADRSWLGVQLEVPTPALAAQLGLGDKGLVVLNVAQGGPADQAGVEQYDVIVSLSGEDVSTRFEDFAERVGSLEAGREMSLVVVRLAQQRALKITLEAWPQVEVAWSYETPPQRVYSQDVAISGKVLRLAPDGKTMLEDLGDIPLELRGMLPSCGRSTTEVWLEDGRLRSRTASAAGGATIDIEQDVDGSIHVTRRRAGGPEQKEMDVESAEYADADQLAAADPEALEIYHRSRQQLGLDPAETAAPHAPSPLDDQLRSERFQEWSDAFRAYLREADERLNETSRNSEMTGDRLVELLERLDRNLEASAVDSGTGPRERAYSFSAGQDGSVTVTVRRGDAELTRTFASAEALREQMPEVYERYRQLQPSEE